MTCPTTRCEPDAVIGPSPIAGGRACCYPEGMDEKQGISSEPTQTCQLCGRVVVVRESGRGFPPDTAKRKLQKLCSAAGCPCEPRYRAGISSALVAQIRKDMGR